MEKDNRRGGARGKPSGRGGSRGGGGGRGSRDKNQPKTEQPARQPSSSHSEATTECNLVNDGSTVGAPDTRPTVDPARLPKPVFKPYVPRPDSALVQRIRAGEVVVATLGVPKWTNGIAFARNPSCFPFDVCLQGQSSRSTALPGDVVAVELLPQDQWKTRTDSRAAVKDADAGACGFGKAARDGTKKLPDGRKIHSVVRETPAEKQSRDPAARLQQLCGGATQASAFPWPANKQPDGRVIEVLERRFDRFQCCRVVRGREEADDTPVDVQADRYLQFKPYNDAYPHLAIYGRDIPSHLRDSVGECLLLVEIKDAPVYFINQRLPVARVHTSLGRSGTVEAESRAISHTFHIKDQEFSDEVVACVMDNFTIPDAEELKAAGRRDLRDEEFVCTIDPATARDLDDALSITETPGGYRVGVHIADVSHFVPKDTDLDQEAHLRGTSTYFVERVIPMLPRKLCEDYCSLNAGVDKFAFSGIWHFDRKGQVTGEWFGQSVIRNRCRMAYGDAQKIIEGDTSGDSLVFINEEAPREELVPKVVRSVQLLQKLAIILRANRFERGAISLNKSKLQFMFEDFNSRLAPKGLKKERSAEANWLVEEFMLHANFRVAEKVVEFLPEGTLLRKHDRPDKGKLAQLVTSLKRLNIEMKVGSSKQLNESLQSLEDSPHRDSIRLMSTLCMRLAQYTNSSADEDGFIGHYALAATVYSHFTSPIRRYADLITHRQLLLALDIEREVKKAQSSGASVDDINVGALPHARYLYHAGEVDDIAVQCNSRKAAAKKAGDASMGLFLCQYLEALRLRAESDPTVSAQLKLRAVVARYDENKFMLDVPDLGFNKEVFHNSTAQRWVGENTILHPDGVTEEHTGFAVNWGPDPAKGPEPVVESVTLLSDFIVTLVVSKRNRPYPEVDLIVMPPWERHPSVITPVNFGLESLPATAVARTADNDDLDS